MHLPTVAAILLIVFLPDTSKADCPNIIKRSEWGARSAETNALAVNPPTHVVIHHSVSSGCTTQAACSRLMKAFQNYHMDSNKWEDIGYNFLVGEDGNVYEGRGWGKMGTHAPKFNSNSIGICFIGTFTTTLPNDKALQAAKDLIACGVSQKEIKEDYRLIGHRQVRATICPGDSLYEEIKTWPQWTSEP